MAEMHERNEPLNPLDELRGAIDNSLQGMEDEYNRVPTNTWLDCLGTRVAIIRFRFDESVKQGMLTGELANKAKEKLEKLQTRYSELRKSYPKKSGEKNRDTVPPEEKQEILDMLRILD